MNRTHLSYFGDSIAEEEDANLSQVSGKYISRKEKAVATIRAEDEAARRAEGSARPAVAVPRHEGKIKCNAKAADKEKKSFYCKKVHDLRETLLEIKSKSAKSRKGRQPRRQKPSNTSMTAASVAEESIVVSSFARRNPRDESTLSIYTNSIDILPPPAANVNTTATQALPEPLTLADIQKVSDHDVEHATNTEKLSESAVGESSVVIMEPKIEAEVSRSPPAAGGEQTIHHDSAGSLASSMRRSLTPMAASVAILGSAKPPAGLAVYSSAIISLQYCYGWQRMIGTRTSA